MGKEQVGDYTMPPLHKQRKFHEIFKCWKEGERLWEGRATSYLYLWKECVVTPAGC